MLKNKKTRKRILFVIASFFGLLLIGAIYLFSVALVNPPELSDTSSLSQQRTGEKNGLITLNNNWFRKSSSGLYELYVEGAPFERGVYNGKLTSELVVRQEDHFNEQINKMIPSRFYLHFLKYFVGWFNRNLIKNVDEEYKQEIYGVSQSASENYGYIGTKYQRILNYHAAHDIGHTLQNMALVGCSSFGTWNLKSEDGTMIIGRNFDFYVGDKFAEDKIVGFYKPDKGYAFMSVTWGGFIGVVSGMNEKGLTVTLNAAKSSIPSGSATPVSLVAREILQYAKNIAEGVTIAKKRRMFVSESFLIASAEDHKAVVVEKTPDAVEVYDPQLNYIVCANHFQSSGLGKSEPNQEQMKESASPYRYQRLMELLNQNGTNTVQKTVDILRDQKGLQNANIGMGNEKALNQLLAHHAIVFEPEKLLVWVSTSPWQLGEFIAYDLRKVFALRGMKENKEINEAGLTIPADSFLTTAAFKNFNLFRGFKSRIASGNDVNLDSLVQSNPEYYHTYVLAGDYLFKKGEKEKAIGFYRIALTKVIATSKEETHIREQLKKCLKT
ncbi:MAG: C45 family peptidase [Chitinophagaceae bacterium]